MTQPAPPFATGALARELAMREELARLICDLDVHHGLLLELLALGRITRADVVVALNQMRASLNAASISEIHPVMQSLRERAIRAIEELCAHFAKPTQQEPPTCH